MPWFSSRPCPRRTGGVRLAPAARVTLTAVVAALVVTTTSAQQAGRYVLRGEDALVRAYDFILEARFDQVDAELRRACGPAPPEACNVLESTALWWRILLDPESRALDAAFTAAAERAIRTAEAWTEREPADPEAWFYLGAANAARVQWRVLRNEKVAAARDGKRIRQALEQALALEPRLDDAYFGIGLYKYYADVAPAAAKLLRFLLLMPGGDRDEGLSEMLRARARGRLLQGEAEYQLHIIYLWYEQQPRRALEILRGLHERYPGNPLFLAQQAHILEEYEHDLTATLDTWRTLVAAAREHRVNQGSLAEARARLGIAEILDALHQTDHAVEQLQALVTLKPTAPYSSLALAYLRLGEAQDRMGARQAAVSAYRAAIASAPADDPYDIRALAKDRQRRAPSQQRGEAYRLSLHGWRRLEQNDLPGATEALERSLALHRDPVTHYRLGRVFQARKDDVSALAQFEQAIRGARDCPAPILGNAYLEAGRLHERANRRSDARSYYQIATDLFGAASATRAAARRALDRLGVK
jgi:hypothetical protein